VIAASVAYRTQYAVRPSEPCCPRVAPRPSIDLTTPNLNHGPELKSGVFDPTLRESK
jgi:hypothetical protein